MHLGSCGEAHDGFTTLSEAGLKKTAGHADPIVPLRTRGTLHLNTLADDLQTARGWRIGAQRWGNVRFKRRMEGDLTQRPLLPFSSAASTRAGADPASRDASPSAPSSPSLSASARAVRAVLSLAGLTVRYLPPRSRVSRSGTV